VAAPGGCRICGDRTSYPPSASRRTLQHLGASGIPRSDGEGRGATFIVRLPVQAAQISSKTADVDPFKGEQATRERQERLETAIELSGIRILLVDDEVDALRLVGKVLAEAGASITMAGSVNEAMVAAEQEVPHILISDLGMPDEDGFDLIQWVRAAGQTAEQLPAVALTAFANKGHEDSALLSGFQIHVPKPVDPDRLIAVVASLTRREHSSRQGLNGKYCTK
jgi:CheY-like chemotaxis protein